MTIIAPLKVYLDHAIWIDFTTGVRNGQRFLELADRGVFVPLLSFAHLIESAAAEAANPKDNPGLAVVAYYEVALRGRRNRIMWARGLPLVRHDEIVREAHRCGHPSRTHPEVRRTASRLSEVIGEELGSADKSIDQLSFIEMLAQMLRHAPVAAHVSARSNHPAEQRALRVNRRAHAKPLISKSEIIEKWVVPELLNERGLNPEVVRKGFQIELCPLLATCIAYHNGSLAVDGGEKASDFEDYFHLAGVTAADIAFVDGATFAAIDRGKVPGKVLPKRNAEFDGFLNQMALDLP